MKIAYAVCLFLGLSLYAADVYAEKSVVEDYLANIDEQNSARLSARNLLTNRPEQFKIEKKNKRFSDKDARTIAEKNAAENPFSQVEKLADEEKNDEVDAVEAQITFAKAPFDLLWGASLEYMQHHLGWQLDAAEREGYENVYQMHHNDYPQKSFNSVTAVFGKNNKLWCIFAEGTPLDDDAAASVVLQLFDEYYGALAQKYGNAEVHFEPYTYEIEQQVMQNGQPVWQNGRPVMQIVQMQNPLGGENFLQELQEGKATLYATFHNDEIGVTLGIYVDENAKSHLLLDYKNLPLMEKEEELEKQRKMEGL